MNNSELLRDFAFFSLFHVLGGLAIGFSLRQFRKGISVLAIFFLIWGAAFGLAPLGAGVQQFEQAGAPPLAVAEVIVLTSAVAVAFFIPDDMLAQLNSKNVSLMLWGSVFVLIGLVAGILVSGQNLFGGLLFLIAFGGAGLFMLITGIQGLLREK